MTYKEAANILRNAAWFGSYEDREKVEEAVEMALELLEQMEDDGR